MHPLLRSLIFVISLLMPLPVSTLAAAAICESPYSQRFTTWDPYLHHANFGGNSFTSIRRNVTGPNTQSYILDRRHTS
ncbi:MAG: hypothetical protein H0W78_06675 [Planctomycetes bacterium]|jgi:hypothetical protein|nr:hypothetical protein [Planctomycetota bacterium]